MPIFRYISADSGIFRILAQVDTFMYIKVHSERRVYSGIFRTVDKFSQFHARYSGAIHADSEPYLGRVMHISNPGLFRHVMFYSYSGIFTKFHISRHVCPHSGIFQHNQAYSGSWH